ncbi:MAG: glycosyltransferase [Acidobacteria bacterium]|nr:glycosyltransferase [Acidobacteriota bacterium]
MSAGAAPLVSVGMPVHNEERAGAQTLDAILALDYPRDRLHVLVVSDASTDATDQIVRGYADRGVALIRLPHRAGKSAAENAARTCPRISDSPITIESMPEATR